MAAPISSRQNAAAQFLSRKQFDSISGETSQQESFWRLVFVEHKQVGAT